MTDILPPEDAAPAPKRSGRGQWIALACALAVLLASGVGLAWVAFVHRDAHPRPWAAPAARRTGAYGSVSGGAHYGKLGKLLLPIPHGWAAGPDIDQYGDDTTLSAAHAQALTEAGFGHLTSAERHQVDDAVKRLHIKGVGMRSFESAGDDSDVRVELEQIDTQYARTSVHNLTALFDQLDTKGPKVPHHAEAHCYDAWSADHGTLRVVNCLADEGDLVVNVAVESVGKTGTSEAMDLVRRQLDRIADPGESV